MWLKGSTPALPWLLQLCYRAGVSVTALLQGEVRKAESSKAAGATVHAVVSRPYKRTEKSRPELQRLIRSAVLEPNPPSVHQFARTHQVSARSLQKWFPKEVGELGRMSVQCLKQQRRESYLAAVEAYSAAAEELRAKGVAIHRRTLQETSGLVAFSRNSARARALSEVLARERTNLQPPSADGPAEAAR